MIKSVSMMKGIDELCDDLRKKYYGINADKKDYKDSYVINKAIDSFDGQASDLMLSEISEKDASETKVSKSVNFKEETYSKIMEFSKKLYISEAEICRRLLYYAFLFEAHRQEGKTQYSNDTKPGYIFLEDSAHAYGSKRESGKTIDDYYALPDDSRVELIDGKFYYMASPGFVHQYIVGFMLTELRNHVSLHKGSCIPLAAPLDVRLDMDDKTMVEPDLMIVCDRSKVTTNRIEGAPEMIAEVVSPSNWYVDMNLKLGKYKNAGVREYWIVIPELEKVLVYIFEKSETPSEYSFDDIIPIYIWDKKCEIDFAKMKRELEAIL